MDNKFSDPAQNHISQVSFQEKNRGSWKIYLYCRDTHGIQPNFLMKKNMYFCIEQDENFSKALYLFWTKISDMLPP